MNDSIMEMKRKILDELEEDLDSHEGARLKPKAAISITDVKPHEGEGQDGDGDPLQALLGRGDGDETDGEKDSEMPGAGSNDGDGQPGDDDEDMKMLLRHYMGK